MAIELSLAVGVMLGTALPAGFRYDPAATRTLPDVQARLMVIYDCAPALMMAAGATFMRRFSITREKHADAWRPAPVNRRKNQGGRETANFE